MPGLCFWMLCTVMFLCVVRTRFLLQVWSFFQIGVGFPYAVFGLVGHAFESGVESFTIRIWNSSGVRHSV